MLLPFNPISLLPGIFSKKQTTIEDHGNIISKIKKIDNKTHSEEIIR